MNHRIGRSVWAHVWSLLTIAKSSRRNESTLPCVFFYLFNPCRGSSWNVRVILVSRKRRGCCWWWCSPSHPPAASQCWSFWGRQALRYATLCVSCRGALSNQSSVLKPAKANSNQHKRKHRHRHAQRAVVFPLPPQLWTVMCWMHFHSKSKKTKKQNTNIYTHEAVCIRKHLHIHTII